MPMSASVSSGAKVLFSGIVARTMTTTRQKGGKDTTVSLAKVLELEIATEKGFNFR